jgi:hypothetical protein
MATSNGLENRFSGGTHGDLLSKALTVVGLVIKTVRAIAAIQ